MKVNTRKLITLAAEAFLVFYVISQPQGSAGVAQRMRGGLGNAAHSVTKFLQSLLA